MIFPETIWAISVNPTKPKQITKYLKFSPLHTQTQTQTQTTVAKRQRKEDTEEESREALAMAEHLASIFGTEKDRVNCPFYFKIGACRHGDRCSRLHNRPTISPTLLFSNMYQRPDYTTPGVEIPAQNMDPRKIQEHFEVKDKRNLLASPSMLSLVFYTYLGQSN